MVILMVGEEGMIPNRKVWLVCRIHYRVFSSDLSADVKGFRPLNDLHQPINVIASHVQARDMEYVENCKGKIRLEI